MFHWGRLVSNLEFFEGQEQCFTELVTVSCSFLDCHGGLGKYQICWIIRNPSLTLDADSAHLETGLS